MRGRRFAVWIPWVLSCGLLALGCDSTSPVAPDGSLLVISATPDRIASDGVSEVTVLARKSNGFPVNPGTSIFFSSNRGSIEASAPTDDDGVARALLRGGGEVGLATVRANAGAASEVTVDVQIGLAATTLTLNATPTSIPAEGGEVVLVAVVRDDQGAALEGAAVTFRSGVGTLDSGGVAVASDALGQARDVLTVTPADIAILPSDTFEVSADIADSDGTLITETVMLTVGRPEPPASISLQPTPTDLPVEGGDVDLLAVVRDGNGAGRPGARVTFSSPVGLLDSRGGPVIADDEGRAEDRLVVDADDIADLSTPSFAVTASVPGSTGALITASATILVDEPARPTTVSLTALSDLPETGGSVTLEAVVRDQEGEPLQGAEVAFSSDVGSLSSGTGTVTTGNQGRATAQLTATQGQISAVAADSFQVEAEVFGVAPTLTDTDTVEILRADVVVLDVSPDRGPAAGGQIVTLTGGGFVTPLRVLFKDRPGVIQSSSSTEIVVETPEAQGTIAVDTFVNVVVTVRLGSASEETFTLTNGYIYEP